MRRVDVLLKRARHNTDHENDISGSTGISDGELVQWINDAQDRAYGIISRAGAELFNEESVIDVSRSQAKYDIPEGTYLGARVAMVEFSQSGRDEDYCPLDQLDKKERNVAEGIPSGYIRSGAKIILSPVPNASGKIRVTFENTVPRLDKRRGVVSAVTLDDNANSITSLTLDTTEDFDMEEVLDEEYFCVVDRNGNQKMVAVPIDDFDEETGVITVTPGFTFEEGETIAVGNYLVKGENSTTHCVLPNVCERYLIKYLEWEIDKEDSSLDANESAVTLTAIDSELEDNFTMADTDMDGIPVVDTSLMGVD